MDAIIMHNDGSIKRNMDGTIKVYPQDWDLIFDVPREKDFKCVLFLNYVKFTTCEVRSQYDHSVLSTFELNDGVDFDEKLEKAVEIILKGNHNL